MIKDQIAPKAIKELFPSVELPSGYTGGGAVVNFATAKLQNVAGAATSSGNPIFLIFLYLSKTSETA